MTAPSAGSKREERLRVHVSVVSGADEALIVECLDSVLDTTSESPFDMTVTAVVNDPTSELGAVLRSRFPSITVIENEETKGFAANQNAARAGVTTDYFLLTNDDIVFLPRAIDRAVKYMQSEENARVGVVGPKLLNPDGTLQRSTYGFPTFATAFLDVTGLRSLIPFSGVTQRLAAWLGRGVGRSRFWPHDRTLEVDTFRGAAMLVRAAAVAEVGPMEEVALVGVEETEWHKRFHSAGWTVVFLHDAEVVHYGSRTVGSGARFRGEHAKGLVNFFWKHHSRVFHHAFALCVLPVLVLRTLGYLAAGRRQRAAWEWEATTIFWRWGIFGPPRARKGKR